MNLVTEKNNYLICFRKKALNNITDNIMDEKVFRTNFWFISDRGFVSFVLAISLKKTEKWFCLWKRLSTHIESLSSVWGDNTKIFRSENANRMFVCMKFSIFEKFEARNEFDFRKPFFSYSASPFVFARSFSPSFSLYLSSFYRTKMAFLCFRC